jgi:hypothetical protein
MMAPPRKEPLTEKFAVRFTKPDLILLNRMANAWRCDRADVIRKALAELFAKHGYLDADQKKAFEIKSS